MAYFTLYSAVGNKAMADAAYDKLMLFYDAETGGFTAAYDEYISANTESVIIKAPKSSTDVPQPPQKSVPEPIV